MVVARCILIVFSMLQFTYSFDVDYYFSSPLRSKEISCSGIRNLFCHLKCGTLSPLCIKDECYCLSVTDPDNKNNTKSEMRSPDNNMDFEEEEHTHSVYEQDDADFYRFRPTLRHHIAHFCPNFDLARQCIKKCMKQGKPAFCGKDHVCYCGHKYVHMEDGPEAESNAKDIYAQFKDLYKKYFGIVSDDNLSV